MYVGVTFLFTIRYNEVDKQALGDEKLRECSNCNRLGHECKYGVNLSFNDSRATSLSDSEASALRRTETGRSTPQLYEIGYLLPDKAHNC